MELKPQNDWLLLTRDYMSNLRVVVLDQIMQIRVGGSSVKPPIAIPLFCGRRYRSTSLGQ